MILHLPAKIPKRLLDREDDSAVKLVALQIARLMIRCRYDQLIVLNIESFQQLYRQNPSASGGYWWCPHVPYNFLDLIIAMAKQQGAQGPMLLNLKAWAVEEYRRPELWSEADKEVLRRSDASADTIMAAGG